MRHPILWQAIVWALPALVFGAVLRGILLWYSPYAYWGSDSRSFFGFTEGVLTEGYFSINEKRRYLYPILMLPISLLPGGTLRWLAVLQAGFGLSAVLAFAYVVRRCFAHWNVWIVPLSMLYAGLPIFIWYEHKLIAEGIFFPAFVWAIGGWVAFSSGRRAGFGSGRFWWFFVPFAILVLTKPAARFFWPGLLLGLLLSGAWRHLRWPHAAALAALFAAGLTVGDDNQGAWLLYTTAFPLTQLDTPLHARLKSDIREEVLHHRQHLPAYARHDKTIHNFLRSPEDFPQYPNWKALAPDEDAAAAAMKDLAIEGILARPHLFLYVSALRAAGSARLSEFKTDRFAADYFARRHRVAAGQNRNPEEMLRIAFGIRKDVPFPDLEEMACTLAPRPNWSGARFLESYASTYGSMGDLFVAGEEDSMPYPTPLGWWVLAGSALALLPMFRKTLGVWVPICIGYVVLVYLVGVQHARYFGPVWPMAMLLLPVPIEAALSFLSAASARRARHVG
jgi:hypothetical protein